MRFEVLLRLDVEGESALQVERTVRAMIPDSFGRPSVSIRLNGELFLLQPGSDVLWLARHREVTASMSLHGAMSLAKRLTVIDFLFLVDTNAKTTGDTWMERQRGLIGDLADLIDMFGGDTPLISVVSDRDNTQVNEEDA